VTLEPGSAVEAAAGNWRWLTDLQPSGDALYAGVPTHPLRDILALQFGRVASLDRDDPRADQAAADLSDGSFDYAALPRILEWWPGGEATLASFVQRVLRPGGWAAIAGKGGRHPGSLVARLRAAGFGEVRRYGLSPDDARPFLVIPRTRAAALACEQDRARQQGGNRLRVALAAVGLHDVLYGGWLCLARR
jgi:hypothetical protein